MDRRSVIGLIGAALGSSGLGLIGTWAAMATPSAWLITGGVVCTFLGASALLWLWWTSPKEVKPMARDTFNNFGTNQGIMGPVTFGQMPFRLTDDLIKQVIQACPPNVPVKVIAVGSDRADEMLQTMAAALQQRGYTVELERTGILAPPPSRSLSVAPSPSRTVVTIAPDA